MLLDDSAAAMGEGPAAAIWSLLSVLATGRRRSLLADFAAIRYAVARQGPKAPPRQPKNRLMMNSTRKMKNNTCAMLDAVAAMPPNPKMPATMATTRKINAQYNIVD